MRQIFVVDDDAPVRELVVQALSGEGYAVRAAADGAEALAQLRNGGVAPRLILLDWRMPTPGDVFAREYRALPGPHAPIVVLTAGGDAVDAAVSVDARGFVRKPFDVDELLDLVGRIAGPPNPPGPPDPGRGRAESRAAAAPLDAEEAAPAAGRAEQACPSPSGRRRAGRDTNKGQREAALRRMANEVQQIRAALDTGRRTMQELLETEQRRRLTPEEAARVRELRWESERLRWELSMLRDHFEQIRSA